MMINEDTYITNLQEADIRTVRFVIHNHYARRAGKHQDLRFEIPNRRNWASFAVPKGVPTEPGNRVLAIRTHDHSEKEALFTGDIPPGEYGSGKLEIYDQGLCRIEKYTSAHIILYMQGSKVKGLYHLISVGNIDQTKYKQQQYILFKSKSTEVKQLSLSGKEKMLFQRTFDSIAKFLGGKIS